MDFSTLRTNLESGKVYRARKEFYRDVMLIFDNAINFHAEIKENAWIVKIATSMKKIAIKEKKATEKRIKGDTGGGGGDTASITSSKVPADEDSGAVKSKKRKNSTESVGGESKKKIKLSLKKSSTASVSSIEKTKKSIPPATAAIPTDVVTSTKTKTPVVSSTSPKEASTEIPKETPKTSPEDSVKSKKPKLKLRLSLNKASSNKKIDNEVPTASTSNSETKRKVSIEKKDVPEKKETPPEKKILVESKKAPDKKQTSEKRQSLEKKQSTDNKLASEKRTSSEKKLPADKKTSSDKKHTLDKKLSKKKLSLEKEATTEKKPSPEKKPSSEKKYLEKKPSIEKKLSSEKVSSEKSSSEKASSEKSTDKKLSSDKRLSPEKKTSTERKLSIEKPKQSLEKKSSSTEKKSSSSLSSDKPNVEKMPYPEHKPEKKIKKSIKVKIGAQVSNSRGKELPKNVAAAAASTTPTNPKDKKSSSDLFFSSKPKASKAAESIVSNVPDKKPSSSNNAAGSNGSVTKVRPVAPSRGKELPSGAKGKAASAPPSNKPSSTGTQPAPTKNKEKKSNKLSVIKAQATSTNSARSTPVTAVPATALPMDGKRKAQCLKFLSALKRRQPRDIAWFMKPVNDSRLINDYKAKISHPMDLGTLTSKLENNKFRTVPEFVRDVRRIWGNCLKFNTIAGDSFRPVAAEMTKEAESLLRLFVQEPERPSVMHAYPPLLYCWQLCLNAIEALLGMKNPDDGLQTAHFFLHPASFYFGGDFPPEYKEKVQRPMDLGTVTSNLMEGLYQTVAAFVADCSLICKNCYTYNEGKEDGAVLATQAKQLESLMQQQMGALMRYDQSAEGNQAKHTARNAPPAVIPRPPKSMLMSILTDLRDATFTDRFTKLSENASLPFEKPVDVNVFRDYPQFVSSPMNLETIERKVQSDQYLTPEDFEYDMNLIFTNCEKYNAPKKNDHILALSKHLAKVFRKLYQNKIKNYEENMITSRGQGTPTMLARDNGNEKKRPRENSPTPSEMSARPLDKKSKKDGKAARRSISRVSSIASMPSMDVSVKSSAPPSRDASPKPPNGRGSGKKGGKKITEVPNEIPQGPVTLTQAIERVQAQYPGRRNPKVLENWEAVCHRFYRDLLRHPWLNGSNPKFIFHAPVTTLYPEVADVYLSKVEKPMDLTTAESKLLSGGLYKAPQDFVKDIALVFGNAISFNKIGRDDGVAMSCAYYEASTHLLRYTRWLSLDSFSNFLMDDSEIGAAPKEGAYQDWKLTTSYKQAARTEMEGIVLKFAMEKSETGEKFTWGEMEIEKLLKALRHQSDLRYMTYFISANFPGDYAAYVSKPMAWETVSKNLQDRKYENIGFAVNDLRLIFSNALKYNARAKGTDTVSGRAYQAAQYMSIKLENAIQKMLLSVSDRLEREHVEDAIGERDAEAVERAEEADRRAAEVRRIAEWQDQDKKEKDGRVAEPVLKTVKAKPTRKPMDFDFDQYEDDIADHKQTHMEATTHNRMLFDKQREYRKHMFNSSITMSSSFFAKIYENERKTLLERTKAALIAEKLAKRREEKEPEHQSPSLSDLGHGSVPAPTNLIPGQAKVKIQLGSKSKTKNLPPAKRITFMDDDDE